MYKIPEDLDLLDIKNEIISQIAFGLNFITLFWDKGFIQFSGAFSFENSGRKHEYDEVYPVQKDYGLLVLLEKKITQVDVNKERNTLTLIFEDDVNLKLIGSEEYESFSINIHGKSIVV